MDTINTKYQILLKKDLKADIIYFTGTTKIILVVVVVQVVVFMMMMEEGFVGLTVQIYMNI